MEGDVDLNNSGTGDLFYSGTCDVLHVGAHNYGQRREATSQNRIMSSYFRSLEAAIVPRGLALKYAVEGTESYWLKNKRYDVADGKYLLVNETLPALDVAIKNTGTWSICVDIDLKLVNDVLHQVLQPDDIEGCNNISRYLLSPELFVREAVAGERLQELLTSLLRQSATGTMEGPALEPIYELATLLVQEHIPVITSYYKLQTAKLSTRKELFQRMLLGQEILNDSLFQELSIKQVADACCLSEFRFYRLFKQCFGVSPYHYLIRKRIEKSIELRKQGLNWSEISCLLNFTDQAAFSKSFKNVTGVVPTRFGL